MPAVEFTAWGRRGGVGEQAVLAHTAWLSPRGPCEGVVCQDEAGCCLWTEIMVLTSMAPARTHDMSQTKHPGAEHWVALHRALPGAAGPGRELLQLCLISCLWPRRCSCQESAGSSLSSLSNFLFKGRVSALLSWLL